MSLLLRTCGRGDAEGRALATEMTIGETRMLYEELIYIPSRERRTGGIGGRPRAIRLALLVEVGVAETAATTAKARAKTKVNRMINTDKRREWKASLKEPRLMNEK